MGWLAFSLNLVHLPGHNDLASRIVLTPSPLKIDVLDAGVEMHLGFTAGGCNVVLDRLFILTTWSRVQAGVFHYDVRFRRG